MSSTTAGASLVQWNRINENVIASAHDSDIRIWDMRVIQGTVIYKLYYYFVVYESIQT